jgi:hypothetical protein
MKMSFGRRLVLGVGLVAVLAFLCVGRAATQERALEPTYGSVKLKAGFLPDPYEKKLEAGGPILTDKGNLKAYIAKAPDFKLFYEAGGAALTIHVESKADTTLLINLPDGTWIADDDSGGNLNPLLKFAKPQSGRYDIWVGTIKNVPAAATLKITELK